MDSRLGVAGIGLFLVAYAQTTPLFSVFGVELNNALALAIVLAFSYDTFYEYAFLALAGALGLASGIGFFPAILFFAVIFAVTNGVRRFVPWQPLLSGIALVLFFTFVTSISLDWHLFVRLAPQFVREALFNGAVFAALYALIPPHYARQRRY